ncbi:AAA family ATPase [Rhodobacteraceae bacterium]|nr:AAA family ATPase [Paracoccaceae bacterium]
MSKSTPADRRRHSLYPYSGTKDFGALHHDNKFFKYLHPQEAIKLLDEQSEDLFIEEEYRKIPILRGCTDRILYGNKDAAHTNCYSVIVQNEEFWMLYDSCQYEDQAELLSEINDSEGWPVWHQDIPKIIEGVGLSSVYLNPFPGFDNPDKKCTPNEWLVQNMFPARSLNAIVGVSDSFKSFLAVHLACCITTGTKFYGRDVQQGPILFLAPEGGAGIPKRRDAWKIEHGWQDCYIPFFTRSTSFSFSTDEDLQFLRDKFDVSSQFAPKAVFFDTLGQSLGAYDENSAKDVNKVARYLNDLKSEFNCAFFLG